MRAHLRVVAGLVLGLALGATLPALATSSGGARGGTFSRLALDEIDAVFSTTSTTYVDVTGATTSPTATASETWLVVVTVTGDNNSTTNYNLTRIVVDGTVRAGEGIVTHGTTSSSLTVGLTAAATGLTVGARIVKLHGRVSAGTGSWRLDAIEGASTTIEVLAIR